LDGIIDNLINALDTWNEKLTEIWLLLTESPQSFKGGVIWDIIEKIHGALLAIGLALLVLFFVFGIVKSFTNFNEIKRPEQALKLFIRFVIARALVVYGMELMIAVFDILPVLGTGGILLPWTVVLLVMKNFTMGIGMFVLYLVISIIRNTMEPKLVGKQIGLHPLATMISLYVGLKIMGFWGMLIFPTSLAVLSSMKKEIEEKKYDEAVTEENVKEEVQ